MHHIYRMLAVCVTAIIFASCGKDPENDPVKIEVSSVTLDQTEITLEPGASALLKATVSPENAEYGAVAWTSDNAGVATVDNGTVTAVAKGSATVTVTVEGQSASCKVTVKSVVSEIVLSQAALTVEIGKTAELMATVLPEDAEYSEIVWESDNASVASVDAKGVVTGVAEGSASIIARAGDKSASCAVTVTSPAVIYATGYDSRLSTAFSWKLGDYSATDLSSDPNQATRAYGITLSGDDVYIGGSATSPDSYFIPTLWKNGKAQSLMDVSMPVDGDVQDVCSSDGDVYAVGWYRVAKSPTTSFRRDAAVIWKNGTQKDLTTGDRYAQAFSVCADGDKVFIGGFTTNSDGYATATLWTSSDRGGTFSSKTFESPSKHTYIEGVCVYGNDVYMVGFGSNAEDRSAMLWKNDEPGKFLDAGKSYAYSVDVADGHVYVAGYTTVTYENGECAVATLWVDGVAQLLTDIKKSSQAWDVVVRNGNVYVSGFIGGQPVIWRNGEAGALRYGNTDASCVTGIYVK